MIGDYWTTGNFFFERECYVTEQGKGLELGGYNRGKIGEAVLLYLS